MHARPAGIILCGGASRRMGRDKAWLPFGPGTLLEHMVARLAEVTTLKGIVVVAGREQRPPLLNSEVRVLHEPHDGEGPLPALIAGLAELPLTVGAAFVTAVDAPLLRTAVICRLMDLLEDDCEAVVSADAERLYPLSAVYRRSCLEPLQMAAAAGERSLQRALRGGVVGVRIVDVAELRDLDPRLESFANCNTPADYERALRLAGYGA